MPENFRFEKTNEYVKEHIDARTLNTITVWQDPTLDYTFEFHNLHEAGWPCYLREESGTDSLPKINLKVPTKPPVVLEGKRIKVKENGLDFKAVIVANIPHFQKLAEPYYEKQAPPPPPPARAMKFPCTNKKPGPGISAKIPASVAQGGELAWWTTAKNKPQNKLKCPLHKSADCLGKPEVLTLTPVEATKVTQLLVP